MKRKYTALLDANVLYSAQIRDLVLQLARDNLYRAHWTSAIQNEWTEALLKRSPEISRRALLRTRRIMDKSFRGALLSDFEHLIDQVDLPDPNDRHVVAAAIHGNCDLIVTQNLADFPAAKLGTDNISAVHPDQFLTLLFEQDAERFCHSVKSVRSRLTNPPYSVDEYLDNTERKGLVATASLLRQFAHSLD